MNKKLLSVVAVALISTTIISCSSSAKSSKVTIEVSSEIQGQVYKPTEVTITETLHTVEEKRQYNTQVLPSIGKVNMLVIPIIVPQYDIIDLDGDGNDDKDQVIKDLNKVFFAKKDKKLGYESVASFYNTSSYGQLQLGGEVTDWFDPVKDGNFDFTYATDLDYPETFDVVRAAVHWARDVQKIDLTKYDSDKDGYIDGVWCIYSCPNYMNGGPRSEFNNFWAYTSWGNQSVNDGGETPKVNDPIYNLFGWASYDFMYEGYGKDILDAHTYIHETGHFLGLGDYYSDSSIYNPIGKVDMMDANIIDHNSYSKMLLGWSKPYIVTGGKHTINLLDMENKNSLIVIPGDSYNGENKFDPFSEYILIELYTNDGLNNKDSRIKLGSNPLAMNDKGVRIYHIDNRKFVFNGVSVEEYTNQEINSTNRIILPISNKRGYDQYNSLGLSIDFNLFDEIRLIEADNVDSFSSGGYQKSKSLFKEGKVFDIANYSKFFINDAKFNNGDSWSFEVKIGEIV